jgi:Flp pilus assembly protein CpaB
MKLVLVAILSATLGAGVTYALVHKHESPAPALVPVVVPTQDIPSEERVTADELRVIQVPEDQVVPNAVTDLSQVVGHQTFVPIYQNEQIPMNRINSGVA